MSEAVHDRLARMLTLVPWLSARQGISLTEAANHFNISVDQLTKDLWQLVVCGLPGYGPDQLVDIDFWDDDRIWVQDALTLTAPLRITPEEGAALSIALRLMSQIPGLEYREDVEVLIAKLDRAIGRQGDLVQVALQSNENVREIIDASFEQAVKISLTYSSGSDQVTERRVTPIRVFAVDDFLYLEGFCDRAEARRVFRFDRILALELTTESISQDWLDYLPANSGNEADAWFRFEEAQSEAPRAVVQVSAESSWVAEEPWVTILREDPLTISVPYFSNEWLISWIMSFGGTIQILEPTDASQEISRLARASLAALSPKG